MTRPWDELTCPECGALNVVVLEGEGIYVMRICEACGKEVEFTRDPWSYGQFLDRIKKHRKVDLGRLFYLNKGQARLVSPTICSPPDILNELKWKVGT
jgi:hypothetical protein